MLLFFISARFFREIDSAESKNKMIEESNIKCFCTIFREIDQFPTTKAHPIPNNFYVKMKFFFFSNERKSRLQTAKWVSFSLTAQSQFSSWEK